MFNKELKFKDLVSHWSGAVAALEGPKDVTEHMVRFVCDVLETWGFGVCVSSCAKTSQQRWLCRTLLSEQDNSRRFRETRPGIRMEVWDTVNRPSKRWRNRFVQSCFKCTLITVAILISFLRSCRFFSVRHAAWTLTRNALKADGQTSFFMLMSKDYHGEAAKFPELVW